MIETRQEASVRTLRIIRGLLAQSEDKGATDKEREQFAVKASELIAKYQVDSAMLAAEQPQAPSSDMTDERIAVPWPYAKTFAGLLSDVANVFELSPVMISRPSVTHKADHFVHVFGSRSDINLVKLLADSYRLQAAAGIANLYVPAGQQKSAFRESWIAGFGEIVAQRLRAARRTAVQSTTGAELVLYDKAAVAKQARDSLYPQLGQYSRSLSGLGRSAGRHAGQVADLGLAAKVSRSGQNAIR